MANAGNDKSSTKTRRRSPGEGSVYEDKSKGRWVAAVVIDGRRRKRFAAAGNDKSSTKTRRRSPGEGSVYEDKSKGRWVAAVVIDGRRRKRFAATKTEALAKVKVLTHQQSEGTASDGNITVAKIIDKWLERGLPARRVKGQRLAPGTIERHQQLAERWKELLGSKRLAKLTIEDVEDALDQLAENDPDTSKSLCDSSLKKARTTLAMAIDYAIRYKHVQHNVARVADVPPEARREQPRRSMTVEQVKTFIKAVEGDRLEAMYILMITVGTRPGEAAGMTWDAVDLAAGTVRISRARQQSRHAPRLVEELKTVKSRRTIELPDITHAALRLHRIRWVAEREASNSWADDRLVFPTSVGTLLRRENVNRSLAKITNAAGLGKWTSNELRHTAASVMSDAGVANELIADVLGHADTRMVDRTYRHKVKDAVSAAATSMNSVFGGSA